MKLTRIPALAVTVALAAALLTGCSTIAATEATPTVASSATVPVEVAETPAPVAVAAPVADPRLEVTIGGVVYTGTEAAPLKIGADMPGAPPAAEATFPVRGGAEAIKAAGIALAAEKYTVVIAATFAPDDTLGAGPITGYRWMTVRVNEYGNWKGSDESGRTNPFPTQQAAADAPHTLDGRVLDRSEFVVAYWQ